MLEHSSCLGASERSPPGNRHHRQGTGDLRSLERQACRAWTVMHTGHNVQYEDYHEHPEQHPEELARARAARLDTKREIPPLSPWVERRSRPEPGIGFGPSDEARGARGARAPSVPRVGVCLHMRVCRTRRRAVLGDVVGVLVAHFQKYPRGNRCLTRVIEKSMSISAYEVERQVRPHLVASLRTSAPLRSSVRSFGRDEIRFTTLVSSRETLLTRRSPRRSGASPRTRRGSRPWGSPRRSTLWPRTQARSGGGTPGAPSHKPRAKRRGGP